MVGSLETGIKKLNYYIKNKDLQNSELTPSGVGQHDQLIDAANHLLDEVGTLFHDELPVLIQRMWVQCHPAEMGVQNGASLDRVHPTQWQFLTLFVQVRQLFDELKIYLFVSNL